MGPKKALRSHHRGSINMAVSEPNEVSEATRKLWLSQKLYAPKERVRARKVGDGTVQIFDGVCVWAITEREFAETYEPCAQSQVCVDSDNRIFEYHR